MREAICQFFELLYACKDELKRLRQSLTIAVIQRDIHGFVDNDGYDQGPDEVLHAKEVCHHTNDKGVDRRARRAAGQCGILDRNELAEIVRSARQ